MKKRFISLFAMGISLVMISTAGAQEIGQPVEFSPGETARSADVNENFSRVYDQVNKVGRTVTIDDVNKRVGIGTETPSETLEVNGGMKVGTTLQVDQSNGRVGIGTDTPSETLEVNGRIKDKTGFVMPVGVILPYGGPRTNIPEGWLLCDGSSVRSLNYPDLFAALGTAWGNGTENNDSTPDSDPLTDFNVPKLSGNFMRGVSTTNNNSDPDRDSRTMVQLGGNTGNNVGSYQGDMYSSHSHDFATYLWNGGVASGGAKVPATPTSKNTGSRGGNETRPKNVYVNYIIKY